MERMWVTRLRWRMRGAWLWPCFAMLTLADGLLLHRLPVSGEGPGTFVGAVLVAGFVNLFLVAVLAPLAGRWLRRRRADLPKMIADNYAGTALVVTATVAVLVAGLAHRPALRAERQAEAEAALSAQRYVAREGDPKYHAGLPLVDVIRIREDVYRSCVPGPDQRRWLCLFVDTAQEPAGISRDPDQVPNTAYQAAGGFR